MALRGTYGLARPLNSTESESERFAAEHRDARLVAQKTLHMAVVENRGGGIGHNAKFWRIAAMRIARLMLTLTQ